MKGSTMSHHLLLASDVGPPPLERRDHGAVHQPLSHRLTYTQAHASSTIMNAKTILSEVPHTVLPRTRAPKCLGKTLSRREVAFLWKAILFVLLVVAVPCVQGKVIVKSVSPTRGSLAGGTRVHIQVTIA